MFTVFSELTMPEKAAASYDYDHYWCEHQYGYCRTGNESTYSDNLENFIAQGDPDAIAFLDNYTNVPF